MQNEVDVISSVIALNLLDIALIAMESVRWRIKQDIRNWPTPTSTVNVLDVGSPERVGSPEIH